MGRTAGRFARAGPRRRVKDFVLGLLSDLPRNQVADPGGFVCVSAGSDR
jgi:hypothetical protein